MPSDSGFGRGDRPVINVTLDGAKTYVKWLSYATGKEYRLLTEAEREYVTRAGTTSTFWFGPTVTTQEANFNGDGGLTGVDRRMTVPVYAFLANHWGLFQVHGNVFDIVEDCWHNDYNNAPTDGSAWSKGCALPAFVPVIRGGCWASPPQELTSAARAFDVRNRPNCVGFRVARNLNPDPPQQ
jgi:formylglycine-generating enzyme required for sulfatase activity